MVPYLFCFFHFLLLLLLLLFVVVVVVAFSSLVSFFFLVFVGPGRHFYRTLKDSAVRVRRVYRFLYLH